MVVIFTMYKLLVAVLFAAVAFAEPEADADAYYGYGGYGYYPAFYNAYPNWPGVRGLGFSSTCFGCRGKRSADAEPAADADAAYFYGGYYRGYGYGYHGLGVAGHPGHATSYVARSVQGLGRKKREAEADADADAYYGYAGYGYPYAYGRGYYGRGYYGGYGHRYGYGYGYYG